MLNQLLWVYFLIVLHFWKKTIISTCTFYFCFAYNVLLNMCTFYTFLYYIFHLFQDFVTKKQAFWEFNCAKWGNDSLSSLARRAWWKCSRAWTEKSTAVKVNRENCNVDRLQFYACRHWPAGWRQPTALFYWTNCTFPIGLLLSMLSMLLISKIAALVIILVKLLA